MWFAVMIGWLAGTVLLLWCGYELDKKYTARELEIIHNDQSDMERTGYKWLSPMVPFVLALLCWMLCLHTVRHYLRWHWLEWELHLALVLVAFAAFCAYYFLVLVTYNMAGSNAAGIMAIAALVFGIAFFVGSLWAFFLWSIAWFLALVGLVLWTLSYLLPKRASTWRSTRFAIAMIMGLATTVCALFLYIVIGAFDTTDVNAVIGFVMIGVFLIIALGTPIASYRLGKEKTPPWLERH